MLAHYFVIVRGYIDIPDLYSTESHGAYFYTCGINWRAYLAYICALAPNLYGFTGALGEEIPLPASQPYIFMFEIALGISFFVYIALCCLSPIPHQIPIWVRAWKEVDPYEDSSVEVLDATSILNRNSIEIQPCVGLDKKTP